MERINLWGALNVEETTDRLEGGDHQPMLCSEHPAEVSGVEVVAIDIPVGLPTNGRDRRMDWPAGS